MGYSGNLFDLIVPSPMDRKNYGANRIFEKIALEYFFDQRSTLCEITIEAGDKPGARIHFETYEDNVLHENMCFSFNTLDAAVIEAGRLVHNKMHSGFKYKLA